MSDSELSDAPSPSIPPDSELVQALRNKVRDALKAGTDDASVTVSSMRKAAEEALGLEAGFYKKNERWKEESKRIVHEAFDEHGADASSPIKAESQPAKTLVTSKPPASKKRASPDGENGAVKKRRKTKPALSSEEALSSPPGGLSEVEQDKPSLRPNPKKKTKSSTAPTQPTKPKKNRESVPRASESELSDAPAEPTKTQNAEASDSELSVLIDSEAPPKREKRKSSTTAPGKRGRKPSSAPKTKTDTDVEPDAAEIKRLQGWLVKCGMRKLWGKELKPYESPKAKIKHLKDMLADAGMAGRYSLEKANQIKEERELQADIEAVKEGAERWGKEKNAEEEEVDVDGRTKPKRRLVRGVQAKVLDFLSSDEGEETD